MKMDKKIKEIFLNSNAHSHKVIEDLLDVFQISVEQVILSVDKNDSLMAKNWLEQYVYQQIQKPGSPTITDKAFNHLFSLCEYKKMDVNYLKYFDYIDILNEDNIEKMQLLVEKEKRLLPPFFTKLFNKKQNYKFMKKEFIFKVIDLLSKNNKSLYGALISSESVPKQYLDKALPLLDLSQSYHLLKHKYKAPILDAFKDCCIKNNTTWSNFIANTIKTKKSYSEALPAQYWHSIVKRESAKDLTPIFEALNKKKNHNEWGITKTVISIYEKKLIEEEKQQLLHSVATTDKKATVLKV